jgi:hypothetical protein
MASLATKAQESFTFWLQALASTHIIAIYSTFSIFHQKLCLTKNLQDGLFKILLILFGEQNHCFNESPPPPTGLSKAIFDQACILNDTLVFAL